MTTDASLLVDSYLTWIKQGIVAEKLESGISEITTPFLDRHNDLFQIYVEPSGVDAYLLTDDGYVLSELKASGMERHGAKREEIIGSLLRGHGVSLTGKELQIKASSETLGRAIHSLIQAMISVDDMFILAQPKVESLFLEDVERFLDTKGVRYSSRIKLAGRSGLDHLFDFVIPKSTAAPERILQVVNSPRRDRAERIIFTVNDTRASRGHDTNFYVLVNDTRQKASPEVMEAFQQYDISARRWSQRDELAEALAA